MVHLSLKEASINDEIRQISAWRSSLISKEQFSVATLFFRRESQPEHIFHEHCHEFHPHAMWGTQQIGRERLIRIFGK